MAYAVAISPMPFTPRHLFPPTLPTCTSSNSERLSWAAVAANFNDLETFMSKHLTTEKAGITILAMTPRFSLPNSMLYTNASAILVHTHTNIILLVNSIYFPYDIILFGYADTNANGWDVGKGALSLSQRGSFLLLRCQKTCTGSKPEQKPKQAGQKKKFWNSAKEGRIFCCFGDFWFGKVQPVPEILLLHMLSS